MKANNSNKQPKTDLSLVLTVSFNKNKPLGHKKKSCIWIKGIFYKYVQVGQYLTHPIKGWASTMRLESRS